MKSKLFKIIIGITLLVLCLIIGSKYHSYIRCPIHEITGFYCPGCGLTRMLLSMLKLDFYQAFRYNPLVFIMTPFIIILFLEKLYSDIKKKKALINKTPNCIWYILIVLFIVYGIVRNIIPYLKPTVI